MKKKILVIDDDDALREMVVHALADAGYAMESAQNGVEGTERARICMPDLILCDIHMEKLDGYGTLQALRKDPNTSTIPFIFMNGHADRAAMRQGMDLGADDYLGKPFTLAELRTAVRARLQKRDLLDQQAEKRLANLRANISCALPHELRTPLNGIVGFAEMIVLSYDSMSKDDILMMAQAILDSGKRLHHVIENTLLYAQLEMAEGDEARLKSLRSGHAADLAAITRKVATERAEVAKRADDLSLSLTPVTLAASEEHVARIIDELLDNAFKFSPAESAVLVSTRVRGDSGEISIIDQGRGLKAEHLAELGAYMQFERKFYEQQGQGLGLTISKRLAALYGGTLDLRSAPGQGTQVIVSLPRLISTAQSA